MRKLSHFIRLLEFLQNSLVFIANNHLYICIEEFIFNTTSYLSSSSLFVSQSTGTATIRWINRARAKDIEKKLNLKILCDYPD